MNLVASFHEIFNPITSFFLYEDKKYERGDSNPQNNESLKGIKESYEQKIELVLNHSFFLSFRYGDRHF